jgi:hypothetical protein
MRVLLLIGVSLLSIGSNVSASPQVSSDDAELLRIEALADRAPDRIHGAADYLFDDEDAYIDATTGNDPRGQSYCAQVPVQMKRSDGVVVMHRIDMCN